MAVPRAESTAVWQTGFTALRSEPADTNRAAAGVAVTLISTFALTSAVTRRGARLLEYQSTASWL